MRKIKLHFKSADPKLYALIRDTSGYRSKSDRDAFTGLCHIIAGQQLSTKAAYSIFKKFEALFPRHHPTPARLLEMPHASLREAGFSGNKILSLKDLSQKIVEKTLCLKQLEILSNNDVIARLTSVRGIGIWSAEMFLIFDLKRADIFSPDDLGLRTAIMRLDNKRYLPSPKEAKERAKCWSPYRSFACRILWNSLENTPQ